MEIRNVRIEIIPADDGVLDIRCFELPSASCYRRWKMLLGEAMDLAKWWLSEGRDARRRSLPIRSLRSGNVLVSMATLETIDVRGLDAQGRQKLNGCSLPKEVVQFLSTRLTEHRQEQAAPPS
ncbi:MAG: hypothetical protein LLG01_16875 [Planctomycetaceae bacterium]|nr:hypothetical protein [Planctomycetaceae bacterium]